MESSGNTRKRQLRHRRGRAVQMLREGIGSTISAQKPRLPLRTNHPQLAQRMWSPSASRQVAQRGRACPRRLQGVDEVERPACVDLSLDQDRGPCPDRSAPGSALANCQPFPAVDAVDARRLSLFPSQNEQLSIAEPASAVAKVAQTGA
jgi:hypothetical protein